MNGIYVGTPLVAPDGFASMKKDCVYYFLRSSHTVSKVLMVQFLQRDSQNVTYKSDKRPNRTITPLPLPILIAIEQEAFEYALEIGMIIVAGEPLTMPPWLESLSGKNLDVLDNKRKNFKISHLDRVDKKLEHIYKLVRKFDLILDSPDPDRLINQHARSLIPKQNETRIRNWFYTYITFGRNRNSLFYPIQNIGHWNRFEKKSKVKRGRPDHRGKHYGYNISADMLTKILNGYRRECGLGIELIDIYKKVVTSSKGFNCNARWISTGNKKIQELYQPDGLPFPSSKAFIYHVMKGIGADKVRKTLYGQIKDRTKHQPFRGSFTERAWNLMQKVEADAYAIAELPKGYIEGSVLPPLRVVVRRDTTSGLKTGIGFSQGSETGASYRMAKFCEAISKVKFCALFGITIQPEQWPSQGLSPHDVVDRGPGATSKAESTQPKYRPVIRELSISHSGQSKAIVESSHPKTLSNQEAPNFLKSDLNTIELAKKAIFSLIEFNDTCLTADRVDPSLLRELPRPTPVAIWSLLEKKGRNDSVLMSFSDAVRAFLNCVPAKLTRAGVSLAGRNYFNSESIFEDARATLAGSQSAEIKVYILDACVRHIWLDWEGEIIELEVKYPIPVNDEVKYMSLAEAIECFQKMKSDKLDHENHRIATAVGIRKEYEEQTGLTWNSSNRASGRPKRGNKIAKNEAAEAKNVVSGKKVA